MVRECKSGVMESSMRAALQMAWNMALEYILVPSP